MNAASIVDEFVAAGQRPVGRTARERFDRRFDELWLANEADATTALNELAAAASTHSSALEALLGVVQRHRLAQPGIRSLILDPHDIEDLEQAVLAVVATRLDQFAGRSKFTTWLFTVGKNEARMLLRHRSRRPRTGAELPETGYLARLSTLLVERDLVERSLESLPEEFRVVLLLREVEHLEYSEIAARLDVPVGTVRSRLSRARQLMASAVRDLG